MEIIIPLIICLLAYGYIQAKQFSSKEQTYLRSIDKLESDITMAKNILVKERELFAKDKELAIKDLAQEVEKLTKHIKDIEKESEAKTIKRDLINNQNLLETKLEIKKQLEIELQQKSSLIESKYKQELSSAKRDIDILRIELESKHKQELLEAKKELDTLRNDLMSKHKVEIADLEKDHQSEMKKKLELSRQQTRAVNFGFTSERLTPILASHYNIKDIRYFGETADFIVFDGMDEDKDDYTIVFADAKSSVKVQNILENKDKWEKQKQFNPITALLTGANGNRQRKIVKAIQEGKVAFEVWMCNENGDFEFYRVDKDNHCPLL